MRSNTRDGDALAIVCGDIHLSDKPPVYRSKEPDWFEAMARPIDEMVELSQCLDVPILCAGDVFDKWNSSAHLINFAMNRLPRPAIRAIPGQHDLPYHSYEQLEKSAFYTMMLGKAIEHLSNNFMYSKENETFTVHPFGWEAKLKETARDDDQMNVGLLHKYVWKEGNTYPGADETGHVEAVAKALDHLDVIICGDNHKGFQYESDSVFIWNCGTFMRRTLADETFAPRLGILYSGDVVRPYSLDTSQDVYLDREEIQDVYEFELGQFQTELESLGNSSIDFVSEIRRHYADNDFKDETIRIIEDSINE